MTHHCSLTGCPGEYEDRLIPHTVRHKGRLLVVDHVPAEVCTVCGDVLLTPATVSRLETFMLESLQPVASAPVYEFA
ncbi:MAG: YgiT-type zinc finger protein [Thermomicrobiales bacterium]|nr:YgiT-type zinc finger protein [Thermomicrobiales bacterium]